MFGGELPVLDAARCVGSGDCVAVCPTGCLELAAHSLPWLARPADCVSCGACAAVCPTGAITFPPPGPTALPMRT